MIDAVLPPRGFELQFTTPVAGLDIEEVIIGDVLDELFRIELVLRSTDADIDLERLTHAGMSLSFPSPLGTQTIAALAARASQEAAEETGVSFYRLVAVPPIWLTTQRSGCRIFQRQSVTDIATQIMSEYGGLIPAPVLKVATPPEPRELVTQYGESDWDFLRRILADEGLTMLAPYDGSGSIVLTGDTSSPVARIDRPVTFVPHSALLATGFHVHKAKLELAVTPAKTTLRDYDFERPSLLLQGSARREAALVEERPLERYGFEVGAFRDADAGNRRARERLELGASDRRTAVFDGNFSIPAGTVFELGEHPRAGANIEWLVVRCETHARGLSSRHRLHCIPAAQRHRPRMLPKPRVIGTQTAFVVGEDGREIDVDVHGRVCVKFHWDRRPDTHSTTRRAARFHRRRRRGRVRAVRPSPALRRRWLACGVRVRALCGRARWPRARRQEAASDAVDRLREPLREDWDDTHLRAPRKGLRVGARDGGLPAPSHLP